MLLAFVRHGGKARAEADSNSPQLPPSLALRQRQGTFSKTTRRSQKAQPVGKETRRPTPPTGSATGCMAGWPRGTTVLTHTMQRPRSSLATSSHRPRIIWVALHLMPHPSAQHTARKHSELILAMPKGLASGCSGIRAEYLKALVLNRGFASHILSLLTAFVNQSLNGYLHPFNLTSSPQQERQWGSPSSRR